MNINFKKEKKALEELMRVYRQKILTLEGKIKICFREQPVLLTETGEPLVNFDKLELRVNLNQGGPQIFPFDIVFGSDASNQAVFAEIAPLAETILDCQNPTTIMVNGVSSSGKTHTMFGSGTDPGIVPRFFCAVNQEISQRSNNAEWRSSPRIVVFKLYRNQIQDLSGDTRTQCRSFEVIPKQPANTAEESIC